MPSCKDIFHFTKEGIKGTTAVTELSRVPESGFLISVKTLRAAPLTTGQSPTPPTKGCGHQTCLRSCRPAVRVAERHVPA